jgi:hypothetical protein
MNLIELIKLARISQDVLEKEIKHLSPELDVEYADIYFEGQISKEAQIIFINNESLDKGLEFIFDDKRYINLFPLHHFLDVLTDYTAEDASDEKVADEILAYRVNDA